jgi:nucleoside-diphosphate-sugar epimerase
MSPKDYTIPQGSRILVTGANGYLASHIIQLLLEMGYHVRGTIRSSKPWLNRYFEEKFGKGRFETIVIPDMKKEGAFEIAVRNCAGVIHSVCHILGAFPFVPIYYGNLRSCDASVFHRKR